MKFCLIGEKLSHSYSKEIHSLMGLDYSLIEVERDKLGEFVSNGDYSGFNVTIPYKKDVIPLLNAIDSDAKAVGAINLVNVVDGKLYGYNTDVDGMDYMISRKGVSLSGKNVMILGTGGASNATFHLMKKRGAKSVVKVGRTSLYNYENCYDLTDTEIIINTTPVGMTPDLDGKIIDLTRFNRLIAVFDAVYNPQKTELIMEAERLGLITSNGLSMLVEQALCGEDIWLNKSHEAKDSERLIYEIVKNKLNIVLWGMPSSGKTTVGKQLAGILNREFYDVDEVVFEKVGKTAKQIIETSGEEKFREIESSVVKELACKSGVVIALGGGGVIKEENRNAVAKNGVTIYLERNLDLLSMDNRPLSAIKGVEKLYSERKALYESADITVKNNGDINSAVKEIIKEYENSCYKWC